MSAVDVSVIIPTFRRPEQLADAARSAAAQEGARVEVLVFDDSPEGSGREAIEALADPRIHYAKRSVPTGGRPATVRNEGWPQSHGRYVHFLDDDDVVMPGAYRAHLQALEAHAWAAMSFGRIEPFGVDDDAVARERAFWGRGAERARQASALGRGARFAMIASMLFGQPLFQSSACMVRRSALEATGGFDPLMPVQEDTELHVRTMRRYGGVFIDRSVIRYRVNPGSLMRSSDMESKIRESYARMQRKYASEHGAAELLALKVLGKALPLAGRALRLGG